MKVGDLVRFTYTDGPGSDVGMIVNMDLEPRGIVEVMWPAGAVYVESVYTLKVIKVDV